jgi:endonuclease/exonuclease/phosphatase family metal-dependent hydrolase
LDADILCLNEVCAEYMQLLLQCDWIRQGYVLSHITTEHCTPRGNLLLAKPSVVTKIYTTYRSKMNIREAIIAEVPTSNGAKMFVAGVHLRAYEQYPESRDVELSQLTQLLDGFKGSNDGVVIMGDFNLHHASESAIIRAPYVDVWAQLRPNEVGYTFDYQTNLMIPYLFPPERVCCITILSILFQLGFV